MKQKSRKRPFKSGVPLFFCLCRKYNVVVLAFCLMFNHVHHASLHNSKKEMSGFQQVLESSFARIYNNERGRSKSLFRKEFGSVPKTVGKTAATTLLYILQNPKVGGIVSKAIDYRWNLLAYDGCTNPFSEPIKRRERSRPMIRAMKIVDMSREQNCPLYYPVLRRIFKGLTEKEREQITDYIITRYNEIDYEALYSYFGSREKLLNLLDATMAKEHDIKEDWDDYSVYSKMMVKVNQELGVQVKSEHKLFSPDALSTEQKQHFCDVLSRIKGCTVAQICKFLHIKKTK